MVKQVFRVCSPTLKEDSLYGDNKFSQKMYVTGSCAALGSWRAAQSQPMFLVDEEEFIWESQPIEVSDDVKFKFLVKRNNFLVQWETIPPPFRSLNDIPNLESQDQNQPPQSITLDYFGQLPIGHPKRKRGTSRWIDRKLITPELGSECRIVFGAYTNEKTISILEEFRPKNIGLRMRWGSSKALFDEPSNIEDSTPYPPPKGVSDGPLLISKSGGYIQARSGRFIDPFKDEQEEDAKRHSEHKSKTLTLADEKSEGWSVFKFHCDIDEVRRLPAGENYLELVVVDLDTNLTAGIGHIPLSTFTRKDARRGPSVTSSRVSRGYFKTSIMACTKTPEARPVGNVFAEFLVVDPYVHPNSTMEHCWKTYWTGTENGRSTLDIGHRGSGRSYRDVKGQSMAEVRENTILSFSEAGKAGAEYVELDVMLTKDRVPAVFHDFDLGIEARKLRSDGSVAPQESSHVAIGVCQLTLAETQSLRTVGCDSREFKGLNPRPSTIEFSEGDHRSLALNIPTLEELLNHLPEWLGLNIEIKYPIEINHEWLSYTPEYEINAFIDDILDVIFTHAKGRRIVFSCFHPDACTALNLKQSTYPVLFLSGVGRDNMSDTRCISLGAAISFAETEYLAGIVSNSKHLFIDKDGNATENEDEMIGKACISRARHMNLLLWTWGDENSHLHRVELQKRWGIDAVICDNIGDLVKKGKKMSKFEEAFRQNLEEKVEEKRDLKNSVKEMRIKHVLTDFSENSRRIDVEVDGINKGKMESVRSAIWASSIVGVVCLLVYGGITSASAKRR